MGRKESNQTKKNSLGTLMQPANLHQLCSSIDYESVSAIILHHCTDQCIDWKLMILYEFLVTVKAAPHECVIRTGQP